MKRTYSHVHIGISQPLRLYHIGDTHLALCDTRDNERKQNLAADRARCFGFAESSLNEVLALKAEKPGIIVHSGDLIDFTSEANFDRAKKFASESDCLFAAGNHEFSQYVGEAWEDAAYRNQSLAAVQACFRNDIRFASRTENGVNLVAVDDSYHLFEEWQLERLKAEVSKGLPIVLLMHAPLYEEALFDAMIKRAGLAYVTAAPEEKMRICPRYFENDAFRYRQQKPDGITVEMYEYIKNQPLIKLLLTGHLHVPFESNLTPVLPQYVIGCDEVREIVID